MAAAAAAALEAWQAASRRRRRSAAMRPRRREAVAAAAAAARDPGAQAEVDGGDVLRRIQEAREDLLISDFWSSALETINRCLRKYLEQLKAPVGPLSEALGNLHLDSSPGESDVAPGSVPEETPVTGSCRLKCVCYGVGNFATCVIARNQLAFLLLFLEKCQIPRSHCWVYDPLFSQLEIAVLSTLGVVVLSENEEGKRSVYGEPTVFYMLHCGTALYNNLLWRNWSIDALSKMVIVGNSFRGLEERLLTRILQKHYPYVAKILKGREELAFPQTSQYTDVFNDTSVHWFPVQKLTQLSTDTWAFREEPDYQDCEGLEIIRNKTEDPSATDLNPL
ncbi:SRR1-like protein [Neophocaena asiaeorientalis asiaeorientalis]|uniref:SRR1-like protein n=1 Tax=Neophocaena asiaeorientalis asiaeorientalis TaxID=1706337 RepID=A0A341B3C7_NEOAA|nr:SRR1-like protein [Neophocaena asiaeorientalis asiaeorientalis]